MEKNAAVSFSIPALAQVLFDRVIWRRWVYDPITTFIDLCSTCNVSLIVLSYQQYGHYVHGRSVHGLADTGLAQLTINMRREEVG